MYPQNFPPTTVDLLLTGWRLLGVASGFERSVVALSFSFQASFSGSLTLLFWRRCMYGWCIVVAEIWRIVVCGLWRIRILLGVWRGLAGLGLPLAGAGARSGWIGCVLLRRHSCGYSIVWVSHCHSSFFRSCTASLAICYTM